MYPLDKAFNKIHDQAANDSLVDVDMDMEFDLISSDRGTMPATMNTDPSQELVGALSPVHILLMNVDVHDPSARRQGRGSNGASPIQQQALAEAPERLPRILDNSRQRPVLQHRTRPALHRDHLSDHPVSYTHL